VSSLAAVPIALVTRFLRLDDTVTGGGATLDSPGAGTPGEECRRLAIVGLLEPPRWCAVMAECRMEDCAVGAAGEGLFNRLVNSGEVGVGTTGFTSGGTSLVSSPVTSTFSGSLRGLSTALSASLLGSDWLLLRRFPPGPRWIFLRCGEAGITGGFQALSSSIFFSCRSCSQRLCASASRSFCFSSSSICWHISKSRSST